MEPDLYLTDVDCVQYPGKKRQLRTRVQMLNQNVWRKTIAKLDADLKREEYYEGKRLRPGINFWKVPRELGRSSSRLTKQEAPAFSPYAPIFPKRCACSPTATTSSIPTRARCSGL